MDVGKEWPGSGWPPPPAPHDSTTINRIMHRFRPIAPKPAVNGSVSDSTSPTSKIGPVTRKRAKRKYVRVKKNNNSGKCKSSSETNKVAEELVQKQKDLVDFDVSKTSLPVSGTKHSFDPVGSSKNPSCSMFQQQQHRLVNFDNSDVCNLVSADQSDRRVVESWVVVVDGTAETLLEPGGLGSTDREKMANLETDACPGLISDGMCRVQWVNVAYKRMVDPGGGEWAAGEAPAEVVVRLVTRQDIPVRGAMFTCTVRVVYTWRKEKLTRTMPCDVWKMDFGGFAWRLDSAAALSLGR